MERWSRQEAVRVQERKKNRSVISQSEGSSGALVMGRSDWLKASEEEESVSDIGNVSATLTALAAHADAMNDKRQRDADAR